MLVYSSGSESTGSWSAIPALHCCRGESHWSRLNQEAGGKEYVITYLSRRLLDAESRYSFVERLCLSLYYACTKLRHYLLSSECKVVGQTDVIKHMIQNRFLVGESANG